LDAIPLMIIVFSVCAAGVALRLFGALMGSQAHTFFLVLGGALLGALIGGVVSFGGVLLYVAHTHDSWAGMGIFGIALFMAAGGALLGALIGAGFASGRKQ
jgi:hypothetical protein